MELLQLSIEHFRNITKSALDLSPKVNVFIGANGAGKTSILEASYFLSHGRSFRGPSATTLIQKGQTRFLLLSRFKDIKGSEHQLGIQKEGRGLRARLDGEDVSSMVHCTRLLPTLAVHPGSFTLLTGEPSYRRAFIDWGTFYSDPAFEVQWKKYQRALKQRNAALRSGAGTSAVQVWDKPLIESGELITAARRRYVESIRNAIPGIVTEMNFLLAIEIEFRQGWSAGLSLEEALLKGINRDASLGYTYSGPHRADLSVATNGMEASKFGSRGQIKVATLILMFSQAIVFRSTSNGSFLLLLDDLAAELDDKNFSNVLNVVRRLKVQALVTSLSKDLFTQEDTVFHVKHGDVTKVI